MRVAIAADHGGFQLKKEIIECLRADGFEYKDFGTYSEESVDYPDLALAVAEAVKAGDYDRGIICCGTGIGVSLAANKVPGIRAALCHDTFSARCAREHNDANILTLGQRVIGAGLAAEIVRIWLNTVFAGGRHARRVEKIAQIEAKYNK
ncbi:sugar-phosphate isomerase, RpiB/LacA/LacB family [Desulfofarcimen acetoxidans DSM 771]|uniref:Sugar-phosphate isomerase, RpiB/LacA/LacB family n=1 Tax=Desulfofarcimen acetoxidans (strain ATCC 49208 / DSM 771 / KCTC 5769 / VKM B-1644 / 5575) TaxID=485916 RepID=C8VZA1_DESAS|nr:ribose 5-phosphate isomerase B [Desulfofarcimen acetoxidans]ACV64846.1 sugar-phosphate isomerase, RpiB/LacA/LacB family [Desulfofarcimen acetoxidans DSM 771]